MGSNPADAPNFEASTPSSLDEGFEPDTSLSESSPAASLGSTGFGGGIIPLVGGLGVSALFYAVVSSVSWAPLERYFLGHPVAIAATVLFWVAVAILVAKWWSTNQQWIYLQTITNDEIKPPAADEGPASDWLDANHAGFVAKRWLAAVGALPLANRGSHLVRRLEELLTRQSQRGTSKHLADDLRELSGRDADAAHDSLGLVRIIIWAIPMLGFLGTVIGITQTLGGLDFTDGTAAVDRLKSGLYVAFDTTALGLVLSVVAIFIQFPIERSEQQLLAEVDHRIGHLVSAYLPSDSAADNQVGLIANLCEGIRAAVAESLAAQAQLWRSTIDEAHSQWQEVQEANANRIAEAFQQTLAPALRTHATLVTESAVASNKTLQEHSQKWQETMSVNAAALAMHHQKMIKQGEQITQVSQQISQSGQQVANANEQIADNNQRIANTTQQTRSLALLQQSLDSNLARLDATNREVDRSIQASAGDGVSDAMRTLARAVELLSTRIPESQSNHRIDGSDSDRTRRAA